MRATRHRRNQALTYAFTATLTNGMLLSQVVLGAALTALGASNSSRVLITVFGALNTVIAGLVAFLKSRGQPVRARMFRDDLDRVVDEIENSAVMWLGISRRAHGYDAIDTDDAVTVRSEVARLTRLYDRAVKTNTMNDPDMYAAGPNNSGDNGGLRAKTPAPAPAANAAASAPTPDVPLAGTAAPVAVVVDPDDSPATKAASTTPTPAPPVETVPGTKSAEPTKSSEESKPSASTTTAGTSESNASQPVSTQPSTTTASTPAAPSPAPLPPAVPAAPTDPDDSPASAARFANRKDKDKVKDDAVKDDQGTSKDSSAHSQDSSIHGKDSLAQSKDTSSQAKDSASAIATNGTDVAL
jgi:hypothetical protein